MKKFISMITILSLCASVTITHNKVMAEEVIQKNLTVEHPYEIRLHDTDGFLLKMHEKDAGSIFSEANIKVIEGEEYYSIPSGFLNFGLEEDRVDKVYISKEIILESKDGILNKNYSAPGVYRSYILFHNLENEIYKPAEAETIKIEIMEETLLDVAVENSLLQYPAGKKITEDRVIQDAGLDVSGQLAAEDYGVPLINFDELTDIDHNMEKGTYHVEVPSKEWREVFSSVNPFVENITSKTIQLEILSSSDENPLNMDEDILLEFEDKNQEVLEGIAVPIIDADKNVQISYRSHIQNYGWQEFIYNGEITGTVGEGLRLEAFEINTSNEPEVSVAYAVKVMNEQWSDFLPEGSTAGTVGQAKALEAITVRLEGEKAADYHIYYRTYNENYGWMDWAKNGEKSGTEGLGYQIEAIQFKVVPSNEPFEESTEEPFVKLEDLISLRYRFYTGPEGWSEIFLPTADDTSHPKSENLIEDLEISVESPIGLGIESSVLKNGVWTDPAGPGRVEALEHDGSIQGIRMELTGEKRDLFELYYRVYRAGTGWMDWAAEGFPAGSDSFHEGIHDIQMVIAPRGTMDLPEENAFVTTNLTDIHYALYSQEIGWSPKTSDAGSETTALHEKLLALKAELGTALPMGSITYQVHVQNVGWMDTVQNGEVAGKPLSGYQVEAVRVDLEGTVSEYYDVFYRVKAAGFEDYFAWKKNGESAGSEGFGLALQDIELKLVKKQDSVEDKNIGFIAKGDEPIVFYRSRVELNPMSGYQMENQFSGSIGQSKGLSDLDISGFNMDSSSIRFSVYYDSNGWMQGISGVGVKSDKNDVIRALKISLAPKYGQQYDILYRVHVQNHGWLGWTKNGVAAGSMGEGLRLEAFEVKIVKKGLFSDENNVAHLIGSVTDIGAETHIQNIGWRTETPKTQIFGTTGRSLRLEALSLSVASHLPEGNIILGAFIQGEGWRSSANQSEGYVGTIGQSKRIEELTMSLAGDIQQEFDIYYRVHVARIGWLGWAKNGEKAGSALYQNGIEALEVKLVPRNESFDAPLGNPFVINIPYSLKTRFMDKNDCFVLNQKIKPQGIVLHSTATPGVMAADWFDRWNKSYAKGETNRQVAVHSFVDDREIWQYLPWDHRGWHAGGTANNTHIGIEMCEPSGVKYSGGRIVEYDAATYSTYFTGVWNNAVTLSVILARLYNFTEADIISHNEGYFLGVASNHSDVNHWFPLHGKNMDIFRAEVRSRLYQ